MSLIPCDDQCIYQKDGYCTLETIVGAVFIVFDRRINLRQMQMNRISLCQGFKRFSDAFHADQLKSQAARIRKRF